MSNIAAKKYNKRFIHIKDLPPLPGNPIKINH